MAGPRWTTAGRGIALLVLATVGIGSWWWVREQRETVDEQAAERHPDSYFRSLDVTRHDENGRPELQLKARYAEHFEDEPWILLQDLDAAGLAAGPDWRLTAGRGRMSDDGVQLEAWDDVILRRSGGESGVPLELRTSHLAINTQTEIAESDALVTISQGAGVVSGKGLHASLADDYLELKADVEARYGN